MKRFFCLIVALMMFFSLTVTATADETTKGVVLANVKLKKRNGNTTIYTEFTNTCDVSVDRIDFACVLLDAYGEFPEGKATIHTCFDSDFFLAPLASGKTSNLGHYWSFYSCDGAVRAYVTVTRYHLTDGTTVNVVDVDEKTSGLDEFISLPSVVEVTLSH